VSKLRPIKTVTPIKVWVQDQILGPRSKSTLLMFILVFYNKTKKTHFCSNVEIEVFLFFVFLYKLVEKVKKFFNFGRNFDWPEF
jgi:hypothetical protein